MLLDSPALRRRESESLGYFSGYEEARLQRSIRTAVWFSRSGLDRMVKCSMGGFGTDDGGTNYANLSHRQKFPHDHSATIIEAPDCVHCVE